MDDADGRSAIRASLQGMYGSPFDDYASYDRPRQWRPDPERRLRHLVFLDGQLVDTWTEHVEGTAYWEHAEAADRAARSLALPPTPPPTPPHESVLAWLDSVVGGRVALVALNADPLGPAELPAGSGELCAEVWSLLERVCGDLFDDEFLQACRAALVAVWRTGPGVMNGTAAEVAGALCWMVGRANGCVGAGTPVTQQVLKRHLWVKASFSSRATRFKELLRTFLQPPPHHPHGCPSLLELGSPTYLTSATRDELVQLRDRAFAAAAAIEADQQARDALGPTVSNLTP